MGILPVSWGSDNRVASNVLVKISYSYDFWGHHPYIFFSTV